VFLQHNRNGKVTVWLEIQAADGKVYRNDAVFEAPHKGAGAAVCDGYEVTLRLAGWLERKGDRLTITSHIEKKGAASPVARIHLTTEGPVPKGCAPVVAVTGKVAVGPKAKE
jgi:hypothetical protein